MARFCLFTVLITAAVIAGGWWVATGVFGLEGLSALLVAFVFLLLSLMILTILARVIQSRRRDGKLRELARRDDSGEFVHLQVQTASLQRLTGMAVGFLVTPGELAGSSNDDLVGAFGISIQLRQSASEYDSVFGSLDTSAKDQAAASTSVAQQVEDLYGDQLRQRGWTDQRIRRSAQSAVRMAQMVSKRKRAGGGQP